MGWYECCRDCGFVEFVVQDDDTERKCTRPLDSCGSVNLVSLGSHPWELVDKNTSLRAEVEEGIKIVMSIIGNGLLNEPEFSSILKRARAFAKLDAGKEEL